MDVCRACHGTGRVVERGRHYGDPTIRTTCLDCYDAKAGQRAEDESFARHQAAIREADDLIAVFRMRREAQEAESEDRA